MDVEAWAGGLIDRIYACMLGEDDWTGFLAAFGAPFPAAQTTLSVHDLGQGRGHSAINHGFEEKGVLDYNITFPASTPGWPSSMRYLSGRRTRPNGCAHTEISSGRSTTLISFAPRESRRDTAWRSIPRAPRG